MHTDMHTDTDMHGDRDIHAYTHKHIHVHTYMHTDTHTETHGPTNPHADIHPPPRMSNFFFSNSIEQRFPENLQGTGPGLQIRPVSLALRNRGKARQGPSRTLG